MLFLELFYDLRVFIHLVLKQSCYLLNLTVTDYFRVLLINKNYTQTLSF